MVSGFNFNAVEYSHEYLIERPFGSGLQSVTQHDNRCSRSHLAHGVAACEVYQIAAPHSEEEPRIMYL